MTYTLYSAQAPEELRIASKQHGDLQVISQLDHSELISPASRWRSRHLIAFRLLVQPETTFLSILESNHDEQCPVCNDNPSCPQKVDHARTKTLTEENPHNLCMKTESELMRLPDGFFWVALARAASPELTDQARVYPQRERRQVERDGYTSSTIAIPGSSSPTWHSSSEFEVDADDVDEDEHEGRRSKPEEVTVHLMYCFLQYILSLCLSQHLAGLEVDTEVRPRVERRAAIAHIAGGVSVSAEDDGGICQMHRRGLGWEMSHPYIALLEAKRAFKYVLFDEKSGIHVPTISNENLAQYLGEAVITWKGNQKLLQHGVFLIAATNTFMRFIHFRFGRDYLEYLDAADEKAQTEIVVDEGKDAFVYMHSTKWLNIQSGEGRRIAICHVLALLRWHDIQAPDRADDDSTEDSDQSYSSMESGEDQWGDNNDDHMDTEEL